MRFDDFMSEKCRDWYIATLVDMEAYKAISHLKLFSDGWCYIGYIWECLKISHQIRWPEILTYVDILKEVFGFWDIHLCERIWIPDYWKFTKQVCLAMNFTDLCENRSFLPKDSYIFDRSFAWTIACIHETDWQDQPFFLQSGVVR